MSKTEKATREYLETLSKDRVIELCLQFMFDAEISEQQLDQANERLGKLEDILEKYGLEVEELDATLKMKTNSIKSFEKLEQDRNIWKRACELACQIIISGYCDSMEDTTDWEDAVYQWKEDNSIETYGIGVEELLEYLLEQAKKEGE